MLSLKFIHKLFNKDNNHVLNMFINHMILVFIFSLLYYFVASHLTQNNIKNTFNTYYDCFYLSLVTQSTLGYDNIINEHSYLKNIQILQMMSIFILVI